MREFATVIRIQLDIFTATLRYGHSIVGPMGFATKSLFHTTGYAHGCALPPITSRDTMGRHAQCFYQRTSMRRRTHNRAAAPYASNNM